MSHSKTSWTLGLPTPSAAEGSSSSGVSSAIDTGPRLPRRSISSAFLWRFLDDVWDLLPTEDRQLFETYWTGLIQVGANLEQKALEASMSTEVSEVPVFLTERWNRFVMDNDTTDQFQTADTLVLNGTVPASLVKETAFFDSLIVSNSTGQIPHKETFQFFDDAVRSLRYGDIVPGTFSVKLNGFEFTANRDYVVNLIDGTVQALDDGRIPIDQIVTIEYQHRKYTLGLDYTLDQVNSQIARTASSAIADGGTVVASYTYNGTATLPLTGDAGAIDAAEQTLSDQEVIFSGLLPNRTLTVISGPNAGTYAIETVLDPHTVKIAGSFLQDQETDVKYQIDAFPHGVKVDSAIISIPTLQNRIDDASLVLVEGTDYIVEGGILALRSAFELFNLGPQDMRERQMWAETVKLDKETPYRNFGVLIDFFRKNSEEYKLALQGLWYTFWTGSTPGNLQRGLHILLGLPFARRAGTVTLVDEAAGIIQVTEPSGRIITYTIPSGLDPVVEIGDEVARFDSLTTGVDIIDRNNEPGFVTTRLGRAGIQRFLTSKASRGVGDTDETKALTLLENHLLLPQVLTEAITQRVNVDELVTFLDNMKPQWTEYIFSFGVSESETIFISEDDLPYDLDINLTTTVANNPQNQADAFDLHRIQDGGGTHTGAILPVTGAELVDGETFDIDDGANPRVTFEFDSDSSVTPTATLRAVNFTAADSKQTISNAIVSAINGAPTLDFTASNGGGTVTKVTLTHDSGFAYNTAINEAVADPDFQVEQPTTDLVNVHRTTGEIIAGGTQATGNFRDSAIDFIDLGIDEGDTVRIEAGLFQGHWNVLKRISASTLSLDIDDADIIGTSNVEYTIIPEEQRLDNDAINLRRENIILPGTQYFSPSTLNTKTDIDLSATTLTVDEMKALLLVDFGNVGDEVQAITDAIIAADEIQVGNAPTAPATQDHEIASAALKRTDNAGPTVTDAYAI